MNDETGTGSRSRSRIPVVIGMLLLFAGGFWFFTEGPGQRILSPSGSTVAEFAGPGAMQTEPFSVREGWQIHWDSQSDSFELAIGGDQDLGTVVDVEESARGVTTPVVGGTFYLEVSAEGDWSITVIQGD